MIAESGHFPHLAEFYYHEVLARAMSANRRLAREAIREGELAGEQLVRFPQIIGAPVVVTLVGRTRYHGFLRNCSALGEPFWAEDRSGPAQTPT